MVLKPLIVVGMTYSTCFAIAALAPISFWVRVAFVVGLWVATIPLIGRFRIEIRRERARNNAVLRGQQLVAQIRSVDIRGNVAEHLQIYTRGHKLPDSLYMQHYEELVSLRRQIAAAMKENRDLKDDPMMNPAREDLALSRYDAIEARYVMMIEAFEPIRKAMKELRKNVEASIVTDLYADRLEDLRDLEIRVSEVLKSATDAGIADNYPRLQEVREELRRSLEILDCNPDTLISSISSMMDDVMTTLRNQWRNRRKSGQP